MKRRLVSLSLCLTMLLGTISSTVYAAENEATFMYSYTMGNGDAAAKISHPNVSPNDGYSDIRYYDGVVNYVGNGVISGEGDETSGTRGESYSWSAIGYGDWIYTGLLYNAMGSTIQQLGGMGYDIDSDVVNAILNVFYNGDFFIEEDDGGDPGSALVKINTKTAEVEVLMSMSSEDPGSKHKCMFRNAVEFNGKLYFCGSVDGAPQIWQVDPETDECKMVYGMSIVDFYTAYKQQISSGIRGMCVYKDKLIISAVMKKANGEYEPQIAISEDPEKGFTVIATQDDLFDYPAYHFTDSIYGGSIWEIVEFGGKIYVSICTGTEDNMLDDYTMQSFAIVCGEENADGTWKWIPVVGDEEDGATYTFGIDPERTCSGAAVLNVYGDYLYIGEYNDEEIALIESVFNLDTGFLNKNFEQSVNLYRMDKDENIELVVGDATEMFPSGGLSGIGSGFGHNENQYIWRMTTFNGKLYVGTFDTSSLLEPIGQFSNGNLSTWSYARWHQLFEYIRELLKLTIGQRGTFTESEEVRESIRELFGYFDDESAISMTLDEYEETDYLAWIFSEVFDEECFNELEDGTETDCVEESLKDVLGTKTHTTSTTNKETETIEESNDADITDDVDIADGVDIIDDVDITYGADITEIAGAGSIEEGNVEYDITSDNSAVTISNTDEICDCEELQELIEAFQNLITVVKKVVITAEYLSKAERGFDLYVSEDGVNFTTLTIDGFGDPFNHGLRVFAATDNGLGMGTANPFYGTQWWFVEEEVVKDEETPSGGSEDTTTPGGDSTNDSTIDNGTLNNPNIDKGNQTENTKITTSTTSKTEGTNVNTGDHNNIIYWCILLVASIFGITAVSIYSKRKMNK